MLKGYRTYLAIALTALVVGLQVIGIIGVELEAVLVGILSVLGLYYRSKVAE